MRNHPCIAISMLFVISCVSGGKEDNTGALAVLISDSAKHASCVYLAADEKASRLSAGVKLTRHRDIKVFTFLFSTYSKGIFRTVLIFLLNKLPACMKKACQRLPLRVTERS